AAREACAWLRASVQHEHSVEAPRGTAESVASMRITEAAPSWGHTGRGGLAVADAPDLTGSSLGSVPRPIDHSVQRCLRRSTSRDAYYLAKFRRNKTDKRPRAPTRSGRRGGT